MLTVEFFLDRAGPRGHGRGGRGRGARGRGRGRGAAAAPAPAVAPAAPPVVVVPAVLPVAVAHAGPGGGPPVIDANTVYAGGLPELSAFNQERYTVYLNRRQSRYENIVARCHDYHSGARHQGYNFEEQLLTDIEAWCLQTFRFRIFLLHILQAQLELH